MISLRFDLLYFNQIKSVMMQVSSGSYLRLFSVAKFLGRVFLTIITVLLQKKVGLLKFPKSIGTVNETNVNVDIQKT